MGTRKYGYIRNRVCTWSDTICPQQYKHQNAGGGQILKFQNILLDCATRFGKGIKAKNSFESQISMRFLLASEMSIHRGLLQFFLYPSTDNSKNHKGG